MTSSQELTRTSAWIAGAVQVTGYLFGFFLALLFLGMPYSGVGFDSFDFAAFVYAYFFIMWLILTLLVFSLSTAIVYLLAASRPPVVRAACAVWLTSIVGAIALWIWLPDEHTAVPSELLDAPALIVTYVGVTSGGLAALFCRRDRVIAPSTISFLVPMTASAALAALSSLTLGS